MAAPRFKIPTPIYCSTSTDRVILYVCWNQRQTYYEDRRARRAIRLISKIDPPYVLNFVIQVDFEKIAPPWQVTKAGPEKD